MITQNLHNTGTPFRDSKGVIINPVVTIQLCDKHGDPKDFIDHISDEVVLSTLITPIIASGVFTVALCPTDRLEGSAFYVIKITHDNKTARYISTFPTTEGGLTLSQFIDLQGSLNPSQLTAFQAHIAHHPGSNVPVNIGTLSATSITSVDIATSVATEVSFTIVETGKEYVAGMDVNIASAAAPSTDYMSGTVISYAAQVLVVAIDTITGAGTHADWSISYASSSLSLGTTATTAAKGDHKHNELGNNPQSALSYRLSPVAHNPIIANDNYQLRDPSEILCHYETSGVYAGTYRYYVFYGKHPNITDSMDLSECRIGCASSPSLVGPWVEELDVLMPGDAAVGGVLPDVSSYNILWDGCGLYAPSVVPYMDGATLKYCLTYVGTNNDGYPAGGAFTDSVGAPITTHCWVSDTTGYQGKRYFVRTGATGSSNAPIVAGDGSAVNSTYWSERFAAPYLISACLEYNSATTYATTQINIRNNGVATATHPLGPWTKSGSNPVLPLVPNTFEDVAIVSTGLCKLPDGSWRMYYKGRSNQYWDEGRTGDYASNYGLIGLATANASGFPHTWVKYGSNPIFGGGVNGSPDDFGGEDPQILLLNDKYYLGVNKQPDYHQDLVWHVSLDGKVGWESTEELPRLVHPYTQHRPNEPVSPTNMEFMSGIVGWLDGELKYALNSGRSADSGPGSCSAIMLYLIERTGGAAPTSEETIYSPVFDRTKAVAIINNDGAAYATKIPTCDVGGRIFIPTAKAASGKVLVCNDDTGMADWETAGVSGNSITIPGIVATDSFNYDGRKLSVYRAQAVATLGAGVQAIFHNPDTTANNYSLFSLSTKNSGGVVDAMGGLLVGAQWTARNSTRGQADFVIALPTLSADAPVERLRLTSSGELQVAGARFGTSTTAGYVWTANALGVGSWQSSGGSVGGGLTTDNSNNVNIVGVLNTHYLLRNIGTDRTMTIPDGVTNGDKIALSVLGTAGFKCVIAMAAGTTGILDARIPTDIYAGDSIELIYDTYLGWFLSEYTQNSIAKFSTSVTSPSIYGSVSSGGTLTFNSTSHATKGKLLFGNSAYDEVTNRLGIGTTTPGNLLHVTGSGLVAAIERTGAGVGAPSGVTNLQVHTGATTITDGTGPVLNLLIANNSVSSTLLGQVGAVRSGADNTGDVIIRNNVAGTTTERLRVKATGVINIPTALGNYTNDAAAKAGGLVNGDIYRNGDVLMICHA